MKNERGYRLKPEHLRSCSRPVRGIRVRSDVPVEKLTLNCVKIKPKFIYVKFGLRYTKFLTDHI